MRFSSFNQGLAFSDFALEAEFIDSYTLQKASYLRSVMIFGALVFYLFFIWDSTLDPINGFKGHVIRGAVSVPVLVCLAALTGVPKFKKIIPYLVTFGITFASLALCVILILLKGGFEFGVAGMILIMLYSFILVPLQFRFILAFTIMSAISFLTGQMFNAPSQDGVFVMNAIYLLGASTLGLVAVAIRESEAREKFIVERGLVAAQSKIEDLLYSMLPARIVERIQSGESPVADTYGEVSIVFIDIVGFTDLSRTLSPKRLLGLLNSLFSRFDQIATNHRVDRIKTIGDAYMAVAGFDENDMDDEHAIRAADFALSVKKEVIFVAGEFNVPLDVRIGLHVGTVVAGVVGTKRPAFDCWGEAVNLASRLEGASEVGQIVVSESAALRLAKDFVVKRSGDVELKGIGKTQLHFLEGRRAAS